MHAGIILFVYYLSKLLIEKSDYMNRKIHITIALGASFLLYNTGCQPDEKPAGQNNQDSITLVHMQLKIDSLERELALCGQSGMGVPGDGLATATGTGAPQVEVVNEKTRPGIKRPAFIPGRKVPKAGNNFFAKDMGNYPEGSNRQLTQKDIQHISSWGYKIMLNEIYARHGMSFTDREIQEHFNNQPWYKTGRKNVDKSLSALEKQNIEFLKSNPK